MALVDEYCELLNNRISRQVEQILDLTNDIR
jgi:hypothetical protein